MKNNIISTILLLAVYWINYLSSSGQLGESMVNLRNIFPFEYMPAGWTFAIARGLIYLSLGVWLIRLWTKAGTENKTNQAIIPRFRSSCMLNIIWITFTANERYILSVIVIILLMLVLRKILDLLPRQSTPALRIPFGLYAGRVTMATTIVGISQLLFRLDQTRVLAPRWTRIAIATGIIAAARVWNKRRNPAQFLITMIALVGVASSVFGF